MRASQLRGSVMLAAIRGELVPQHRNDPPAARALETVLAQKAALIRQKQLPKEKPLPPVREQDLGFPLPRGWSVCRLGDLAGLHRGSIRRGPFGSAIRKELFVPKGEDTYKVYEQGNVIRKSAHIGDYYIDRAQYDKLESFHVAPGDILISCAGTLGETFILPPGAPPGVINQALLRINVNQELMLREYFLICFYAITQQQILLSSYGSAMRNMLSIQWLKEMALFPLPPLPEQARIVAKVDELSALCGELETAEQELLSLENHLAQHLPVSILQQAARGKLTPQDQEDEPAGDLYRRIQAEKARLTRDKLIKKDRPLPPVTEAEVPHPLPESWMWCRLGDIARFKIGKTPSRADKNYWDNGAYPWVTIADMESGTHLKHTRERVSQEAFDKVFQGELTPKGSLILSFKLSIGKVCILDLDAFTNEAICSITPYLHSEIAEYLFRILPGLDLLSGANDAIMGKTLNSKSIARLLIPLPPLAEQRRIIKTVDKLMSICRELREEAR